MDSFPLISPWLLPPRIITTYEILSTVVYSHDWNNCKFLINPSQKFEFFIILSNF
jgi:hypothetical protein